MKVPYIDRIWRVKSSLTMDAPQSPADTFDKLDPLFQTHGTSYEVEGDTLTFSKKNPAAQDKLATFTRGTLRVIERDGRSELAFDLTSPALLFCFLAPLLFLAFGQLTVAIGEYEKATTQGARESEEEDEADEEVQLHPIDEFLGAPAPEKPDDKEEEKEDEDDKHSPKTAYILAAIFAALYVVGRILEPWLIKSTFRKTLSGPSVPEAEQTSIQAEAQHSG